MKEYLEEELEPFEGVEKEGAEEQVEAEKKPSKPGKPYLRASDLEGGPTKEVVVLEWMDFLLSKTDVEGVLNSLSHYISMGWITKGVRTNLLEYVNYFLEVGHSESFSEVKIGNKKYKFGGEEQEEGTSESEGKSPRSRGGKKKLALEDHLQSLNYILELSDSVEGEEREEALKRAGLRQE